MVAFRTDDRKSVVTKSEQERRHQNIISHFVSTDESDLEQEIVVPAWKAWLIVGWIATTAVIYFILLARLIK